MKIVLLHGWDHDKNTWNQFIKNYSENEIVVFDLPGFGNEPLSENWGIPEYADWVLEKLQTELGDEKAILIGHSFGGRVAAYIASKEPQWLKKLILYAAPVLYRPNQITKIKSKAAHQFRNVTPLRKIFLNKTVLENQKKYEIFKKVVTFDQTATLSKISVPTLFVWGERDKETSTEIAFEASKLIKNSAVVVLPKLGHNVHIEAPFLFYGTIQKFIASS